MTTERIQESQQRASTKQYQQGDRPVKRYIPDREYRVTGKLNERIQAPMTGP